MLSHLRSACAAALLVVFAALGVFVLSGIRLREGSEYSDHRSSLLEESPYENTFSARLIAPFTSRKSAMAMGIAKVMVGILV